MKIASYNVNSLRARLLDYFRKSFTPEDTVLWVGDLNIAPTPIDVYDPKTLLGAPLSPSSTVKKKKSEGRPRPICYYIKILIMEVTL